MNKKIKIGLICFVIFAIISVGIWWISSEQNNRGLQASGYQEDWIENSITRVENNNWNKKWGRTETAETPNVYYAPKAVREKYLPVWRTLFMTKNNVTESYFDQHVKVIDTGLTDDRLWWELNRKNVLGRGREYFTVLYKIEIDWVKVAAIDRFAIKEADSEEYLGLSEIKDGLKEPTVNSIYQGFPERITRFIPIEEPIFFYSESVEYLKQVDIPRGSRHLKPGFLYLNANGEVVLEGFATIDYENNKCLEGHLNLNTGSGYVQPSICWQE